MKRHYFKRDNITPILFLIAVFCLVILWLYLIGRDTKELINAIDIFLPLVLGIGVVGTLLEVFVINKLYYIKFEKNSLIIVRIFSQKVDYSKIKNIRFEKGILKKININGKWGYFVVLGVENSDDFLKEFREKYRGAVGRGLVVKKGMF